jgi:putative endonuclease
MRKATDMDRQQTGQAAEDAAVSFLESQGLAILLRNFRRRAGELDIVAREGDTLIIVEVRTRSSDQFGGAAASVDFRKQRRLLRAAAQLLQNRPDLGKLKVRFDVIVVRQPLSARPRLEWIKHAFAA